MDSSYTAIPRGSFLELQTQNNDESPSKNPSFVPKFPIESISVEDGDVEIHDVDDDNFPLIYEESSSNGSGISGAVFNLTTSIIGAGIMALPATMKVLGVLLGTSLIVVMGVISEFSIELLVRLSVLRKASSYGEVVESALGRPASILAEICIIINNAGILVVYLIIMGDVLSGSSNHLGVFVQWLGNGVWDGRWLVVLVILVFCLLPLCLLRKIESLSFPSAVSVALAVVFVVVAGTIALVKLVEGRIQTPRLGPDFGSRKAILDLLVVIPIMTNAYICHFNIQPIYNELQGRSPQKMIRVGRITTVICVVVYALTAVSGYLLFGDDTESDVLTNFDEDLGIRFSLVLNYVVRIGYVLHLILVFPVIHFSLRQTVDALAFKGWTPLVESGKRSAALTVVLLILIYLGSTMIPNIWVAFKFTGATTAVSLGFIFPSLIALRLHKQGEVLLEGERTLSWLMLVMAVLVSAIGVAGNVYSLKGESG
ncbi:amino acid transporter AVT6E [Aristolochia californica]|uniref:amino acid transporter AVT6E n=1 Tax=Aristolochia californica TaxID=171875 RepID=UPI0035DFA960